MAAGIARHGTSAETTAEAARRQAHEELREALVDLHALHDPDRVALHCRRVLGLVHLAQGQVVDVDRTLLRQAQRLLAPAVDAHAAVEALARLEPPGADRVQPRIAERAAALDEQLADGCVTAEVVAALLDEVDGHVDSWDVPPVEDGIARTYRVARRSPSDRELVHALDEQLAFAGMQHDDVHGLAVVLDDGHELDALVGEIDLRTAPVGVTALVRARRAELRSLATALAATTFAPAPEAWLASRRCSTV